MNDRVGVIILTYNEEVHIERCIRSLGALGANILVVDSGSTDRTVEMAEKMGAKVIHRDWDNYSRQFAFAMNIFPFDADWMFRVDADEYLSDSADLKEYLASLEAQVSAVELRRKMYFMGKWIRFGGMHPLWMCRLWRPGNARIEDRWMDEHMVVESGAITRYSGFLIDDNRKGLGFWIGKHNSYADREVLDLLHALKVNGNDGVQGQAGRKRLLKKAYASTPVIVRSALYWFYRYFILAGFLDGREGYLYHFLHAFWYRTLVDAKFVERVSSGKLNLEA